MKTKQLRQERSLELANYTLKVHELSSEDLIHEGISIINKFIKNESEPKLFLIPNFEIAVNELYVRSNDDDLIAIAGISYLFTELLRSSILYNFNFHDMLHYILYLLFDSDNLQESVQFEENLRYVINTIHNDIFVELLNTANLKYCNYSLNVNSNFLEFINENDCKDDDSNFLNFTKQEENQEDEFYWPYSDDDVDYEEEYTSNSNEDSSDEDHWGDFETSSENQEDDPWDFMKEDNEEPEYEEVTWNPSYDDDDDDEEDDYSWD